MHGVLALRGEAARVGAGAWASPCSWPLRFITLRRMCRYIIRSAERESRGGREAKGRECARLIMRQVKIERDREIGVGISGVQNCV